MCLTYKHGGECSHLMRLEGHQLNAPVSPSRKQGGLGVSRGHVNDLWLGCPCRIAPSSALGLPLLRPSAFRQGAGDSPGWHKPLFDKQQSGCNA